MGRKRDKHKVRLFCSRARKSSHTCKKKKSRGPCIQVLSSENGVPLISQVLSGTGIWKSISYTVIWWAQMWVKDEEQGGILQAAEPSVICGVAKQLLKQPCSLQDWTDTLSHPMTACCEHQPTLSEQGVQPGLEGTSQEFRVSANWIAWVISQHHIPVAMLMWCCQALKGRLGCVWLWALQFCHLHISELPLLFHKAFGTGRPISTCF